MSFPRTEIDALGQHLDDETLTEVDQAHSRLSMHLIDDLDGGSMACHIEIAARELAIALDLMKDYAASHPSNITAMFQGEQGVIDVCIARAREVRKQVGEKDH